jgi:hypothetical protein
LFYRSYEKDNFTVIILTLFSSCFCRRDKIEPPYPQSVSKWKYCEENGLCLVREFVLRVGESTNNGKFQVKLVDPNSSIYTASGAVSSMRLGNGRFESSQFNSRLQPTQITLGTNANNTSLLKLNYDCGELNAN